MRSPGLHFNRKCDIKQRQVGRTGSVCMCRVNDTSSNIKMEVAVSSEVSVGIYQITWRQNSEDKFRSHRWRKVKSEIYDCIYQATPNYHGSCQHVSALCGLTALNVHGLARLVRRNLRFKPADQNFEP